MGSILRSSEHSSDTGDLDQNTSLLLERQRFLSMSSSMMTDAFLVFLNVDWTDSAADMLPQLSPSAVKRKDAQIAKTSLACSPPKRRRQSVVLYGTGQTHPRALGAIKADDQILPRLRQLTRFHSPLCSKEHVELISIFVARLKCLSHHGQNAYRTLCGIAVRSRGNNDE